MLTLGAFKNRLDKFWQDQEVILIGKQIFLPGIEVKLVPVVVVVVVVEVVVVVKMSERRSKYTTSRSRSCITQSE